jgi:hypothetical protein
MTEPERPVDSSNLIRQVLVAWVVAVWAVAIAASFLVFHESHTEDRMVPRWHQPPAAGAVERDDGLVVRHGPDWVLPRSGSSTAPEALPEE